MSAREQGDGPAAALQHAQADRDAPLQQAQQAGKAAERLQGKRRRGMITLAWSSDWQRRRRRSCRKKKLQAMLETSESLQRLTPGLVPFSGLSTPLHAACAQALGGLGASFSVSDRSATTKQCTFIRPHTTKVKFRTLPCRWRNTESAWFRSRRS